MSEPSPAVQDEVAEKFATLSMVGRLRFIVGGWLLRLTMWVMPLDLEDFMDLGRAKVKEEES